MMKQIWKEILLSAVMGLAVPALLLHAAVKFGREKTEVHPAQTSFQEEQTASEPDPAEWSEIRSITVIAAGNPHTIGLEEYICGVVLAEMPADFEMEALKAQAVVARTYAIRRIERGGKHDAGDICTESGCCQGYLSMEEYLENGGEQGNVDKVRQAVLDTAGQVLVYEGSLIEATYFSCSGGRTEDALAVWGTDIPYLQSTDSPGEENAAHYTDKVFLTAEEFADSLGTSLSGSPTTWLGMVTYTTGGGVNTIQIGGKTYLGTELRTLLNLRSTDFSMTATEAGVEIVTHGYGHRVGMSQYGADAMAVTGSDYSQILAHYYQGTELVQDIP